ncbi:hypothetical protein [Cytobacillus solani]|uniref:hypothetical protein n=1 Tax=Cytobacillus solani TaxID=1637975 RepID=UPI0006F33903|nr:hypothetical protein [Cytobacillus solani]
MTKKVTLPREVAEAIEMYLGEFGKKTLLYTFCNPKTFGWTPKYSAFHKLDLDTLMSALVNGYEIEKSPEEKVREYLNETERCRVNADTSSHYQFFRGRTEGVIVTLNLLGIQIEGINA